uniref:Uncharacterized protein n=1 Tax=viral metagenome TaxID=1070528 RepID=A0A6C0EAV7_9ZZZZ
MTDIQKYIILHKKDIELYNFEYMFIYKFFQLYPFFPREKWI